jgi:hypothetical protein
MFKEGNDMTTTVIPWIILAGWVVCMLVLLVYVIRRINNSFKAHYHETEIFRQRMKYDMHNAVNMKGKPDGHR